MTRIGRIIADLIRLSVRESSVFPIRRPKQRKSQTPILPFYPSMKKIACCPLQIAYFSKF